MYADDCYMHVYMHKCMTVSRYLTHSSVDCIVCVVCSRASPQTGGGGAKEIIQKTEKDIGSSVVSSSTVV